VRARSLNPAVWSIPLAGAAAAAGGRRIYLEKCGRNEIYAQKNICRMRYIHKKPINKLLQWHTAPHNSRVLNKML
jgi:hypothetical protein